jgi:putative Mg2+ transporter-C (MgtC) family protein
MPDDIAHQLDLALRLLIASVLGAAIGLEREIHDHPAGMRTHLLVALGSALFTVMSIFGFVGVVAGQGAVDPSRVAAQIVTGIGFLGAGAILKYGTSVRGLTTAASLWATAAIGVAVGTGAYVLSAIATAIVLISLWPLNWVIDRIHGPTDSLVHLRLGVRGLESVGQVSAAVREQGIDLVSIESQRLSKNRFEIDLDLRVRSAAKLGALVEAISNLADVEVIENAANRE